MPNKKLIMRTVILALATVLILKFAYGAEGSGILIGLESDNGPNEAVVQQEELPVAEAEPTEAEAEAVADTETVISNTEQTDAAVSTTLEVPNPNSRLIDLAYKIESAAGNKNMFEKGVAAEGDIITWSFKTESNAKLLSATIAGEEISLSTFLGKNHSFTYTVSGDEDEDIISVLSVTIRMQYHDGTIAEYDITFDENGEPYVICFSPSEHEFLAELTFDEMRPVNGKHYVQNGENISMTLKTEFPYVYKIYAESKNGDTGTSKSIPALELEYDPETGEIYYFTNVSMPVDLPDNEALSDEKISFKLVDGSGEDYSAMTSPSDIYLHRDEFVIENLSYSVGGSTREWALDGEKVSVVINFSHPTVIYTAQEAEGVAGAHAPTMWSVGAEYKSGAVPDDQLVPGQPVFYSNLDCTTWYFVLKLPQERDAAYPYDPVEMPLDLVFSAFDGVNLIDETDIPTGTAVTKYRPPLVAKEFRFSVSPERNSEPDVTNTIAVLYDDKELHATVTFNRQVLDEDLNACTDSLFGSLGKKQEVEFKTDDGVTYKASIDVSELGLDNAEDIGIYLSVDDYAYEINGEPRTCVLKNNGSRDSDRYTWARYYSGAKLNVEEVEAHSDNEYKPSTAIAGNTVWYVIELSHAAEIVEESVKIAGITAEHNSEADARYYAGEPGSPTGDDISTVWTVEYTIPEDDSEHKLVNNEVIKIEISFIDAVYVSTGDKDHMASVDQSSAAITFYDELVITSLSMTVKKDGEKEENFFEVDHNYPVKGGDTLYISFNTNVPLDKGGDKCILSIGGITGKWIGEEKVPQKTDDGYPYEVSLEISDELFDQSGIADQTLLLIEYKLTAVYGGGVSYSETADVVDEDNPRAIYYAPIEFSQLELISTNRQNSKLYVVNGDDITVRMESNHEIALRYCEIAEQPISIYSSDGNKYEYTLYSLKNKTLNDQDKVPFSFTATDAAGNSIDITHKSSMTYYAPIDIWNVIMTTNNSGNRTLYAKDGDTITVTFNTNHSIIFDGETTIVGKAAALGSPVDGGGSKKMYTLSHVIANGDLEDQQKLFFSAKMSDVAGNTASISTATAAPGIIKNDGIVYYAPIELEKLTMSYQNPSDNTAPNKTYTSDSSAPQPVKDGFILIAEAKFNHEISLAAGLKEMPDVTFAGLRATFSSAELDLSNLKLKDGDAHYWKSSSGKNTWIIVAKLPNKTYRTNEPDNIYNQTSLVDDKLVDLTFTAVDVAENDPFVVASIDKVPNTTEAKIFRYYAPLEIVAVSMEVADAPKDQQGYITAINSDTVTIIFDTRHPIAESETVSNINDKIYIEKGGYRLISQSGTYRYKTDIVLTPDVAGKFSDLEIMQLALNVIDSLGQTATVNGNRAPAYTRVRYYAPIRISNLTITTSNLNDETRYAKDEDTVYISFTANHMVDISEAVIAGKGISIENTYRPGADLEFRFSYQLKNGDLSDLSAIAFSFNISDIAGNPRQSYSSGSNNVINSIKYYAPLVATAGISSSNTRPEYAKNGDSITISCAVNHEASPVETMWGSRIIAKSTSYVAAPAISYTIPEEESDLYEGEIFFNVSLEDPAGNYLSVSEGTNSVIYDRTHPDITVIPSFTGFTGEETSFTVLYMDPHLNLGTVSCTLNEDELAAARSGKAESFTQELLLSNDGNYLLSVGASDMAGNEISYDGISRVIMDTILPIINCFSDGDTFPLGFKLNEGIEVSEEHLKDISCTISSLSGMEQWTLEEPIDEEGKMTVNMSVSDLAGNDSVPFSWDIYIDGTQPEPIVKETETNTTLKAGSDNLIAGPVGQLQLYLASMHIGSEEPDSFTKLQLLDESGDMVEDLLVINAENNGVYSYELPERGTYTLLLQAADDVGNKTEQMSYNIEFRDMYILERLYQGTPLEGLVKGVSDTVLFVALAILAISLCTLFALLLHKRRRDDRTAEEAFGPSLGLIQTAEEVGRFGKISRHKN